MTKSNSQPLLAELAKEINEHDEARHTCEVKGVMHGLKIGELLVEAKKITPHGKFMDWVKENTSVSQRMAQMYMTIARDDRITESFIREYETVSHLTIQKAVRLARRNRTVEEWVERINAASDRFDATNQDLARGCRSLRDSFSEDDGEEAFISWMVRDLGFSEASVAAISDLVDSEYDLEAWLDFTISQIESQLSVAEAGAP